VRHFSLIVGMEVGYLLVSLIGFLILGRRLNDALRRF